MSFINLKHSLDKQGVIFSFCGSLSQSLLTTFAESIEFELERNDVKNSIIQAIFSIFIEQCHNLISYSIEATSDSTIPNPHHYISILILVGFDIEKQKYYVGSANRMLSEHKEKLITKLEMMNTLSKEEIKALYKELRRSGKDLHDRGAGLGFLEMAKKSSEPFAYSFFDHEDNTYTFEFKVFI